ncbi:MAG: hypothetical protein V4608_14510 [Bacteroidota bacterium]
MKKQLFKSFSAVIILLLTFTASFAQETANLLLNKVYKKTQKAQDYSVNAHIKVDLPFIKMLPIDAKIYVKQKDKFKVESKSIALVPRQGFDQISKMIADTNQFTCMMQGQEVVGTTATKIINIIPLFDTTDLILGKLWIDPLQNIVLKMQLTTKSNGTIHTEYKYGTQIAYGLPDAMVFSIDVKKFKLPKIMGSDIHSKSDSENSPDEEKKKGKIYIDFTNYAINKGIPDAFFLNKK